MTHIIVYAFMALSLIFVWTRCEWNDLQALKKERLLLERQIELDELQERVV